MANAQNQRSVPFVSEEFQIHWGGPDRPPRCLRDLLEERIDAVPDGGEILWATYYFRDEALAAALVRARHRGVKVGVVMEGNPRTGEVNSRVRELLAGNDGLGRGLRALNHRLRDLRSMKSSRLHEKLYYFSHPVPMVLVGTFNPSGNVPEEPEIIAEIGDQDRGHNVLVELRDPALVRGLYRHAVCLYKACHGPWEFILPRFNRVIVSGKTRILFFPRTCLGSLYKLFDKLRSGSRLRIAVSHLNDPGICKRLFALARTGVNIEILAHDTERRVPGWVEDQMRQNGIAFTRYMHAEGLPMHNKFMLFETPQQRILAFGSMNLSERSLHANHELLVITEEAKPYLSMERRWQVMLQETDAAN
mgnify:CR=1 FL=1